MTKPISKLLLLANLLLVACSPIKLNTTQYKLSDYSHTRIASHPSKQSILVTTPEAVAGYQTSDMLYMKKSFELSSFANHAWADRPADMLLPLITQSLQRSGYFYAITSSAHSEPTTYRLDTQLIELHQNFITIPSKIDFVVKVVLSHVADNRVIASHLIDEHIKCPSDTPYGGVIAANIAVKNFTSKLTAFVVSQIRQDTL